MKIYTREQLLNENYPYGKSAEGIPMGDPDKEIFRTNPDVVVFDPKGIEDYTGDNEHMLVFNAPLSDELLAIWTQSSCEGTGNNHIVIARSEDGRKWGEPVYVIGTKKGELFHQASWAFPVVSKKGRLYIFYTKQLEVHDNHHCGSGGLGCIYSNDNGYTWSQEHTLPMISSRFDNPDHKYPKNWIVWQKPIRDQNDKHLVGYTLITSLAHHVTDPTPNRWVNQDSRCYFMRFENIDENPPPDEIKITWLPDEDKGIEVQNKLLPFMSTAQEPAIVLLPNGHLFCIMRSMTGYVQYTISEDDGHTWRDAAPLRFKDDSEFVLHPMSPCPLYRISDELYLIAYHNNSGERMGFSQWAEEWSLNIANYYRNPLYISIGKFNGDSRQLLEFGKPYKLLDSDDIAVGPKKTAETGTYTSMTERKGELFFWYPDRKYYLLGKEIKQDLISQIKP
ncbi:MAG: exo-alpha-sialidase [Clostridia bacterium]|nr:exo-alpha-sialidase [Clostridia bacterium]